MNQLYPIIRRARRPLLPPDEPQQRVVIPVTMESAPAESVPLVVAHEELPTVEAAPVVELPSRRQRKERKRAETAAT